MNFHNWIKVSLHIRFSWVHLCNIKRNLINVQLPFNILLYYELIITQTECFIILY